MHLLQAISAATIYCSVGSVLGVAIKPTPNVLHEKRGTVHGWIKRSAAPQDLILPIHIGIASKNIHLGHDILMDISDPDSENFGQHWSPEQIHNFFSPETETVDEVKSWLSGAGINESRHRLSKSNGSLRFTASIAEAEALLGTQYEIYEDLEGQLSVSCDSYHLPKKIQRHIDFVSPTIGFTGIQSIPGLKKRSIQPQRAPAIKRPFDATTKVDATDALDTCSEKVTPACIKALYGIPENQQSVPGNDLGIYEEQSVANFPDLNTFFEKFDPRIPNGTQPIAHSIDGATVPSNKFDRFGGEALLDFDMAFPIVFPQDIQLFQNVDAINNFHELAGAFNTFLDAVDASYCSFRGGDNKTFDPTFPRKGFEHQEECGKFKPTNVISFSFSQNEDFASPAYQDRQCQEYMKLGLQGTSLIFSSGDNGTVGKFPTEGCAAGGKFRPQFPATCPYVTAVGATMIQPNASVNDPEVAVFDGGKDVFTSGGGFSDTFSQPSYQKGAVQTYLQESSAGLPPKNVFNAQGRGLPDVSANGLHSVTIQNGRGVLTGGTSASAPIFASIINRINGERIKKGKKSIGFLNPTLYKNPQAFNDITQGFNQGCNGEKAFSAAKGWDPITGLGTPDFSALLDVFMSLP